MMMMMGGWMAGWLYALFMWHRYNGITIECGREKFFKLNSSSEWMAVYEPPAHNNLYLSQNMCVCKTGEMQWMQSFWLCQYQRFSIWEETTLTSARRASASVCLINLCCNSIDLRQSKISIRKENGRHTRGRQNKARGWRDKTNWIRFAIRKGKK